MRRITGLLVAIFASLIAGCASLPSLQGRSVSHAYADTNQTRLGHALAQHVAPHPGQTGIYPLPDARDAFVARIVLADTADRSLDIQYYIWHGDETGYLLFEAVWRAAERGVRVRLLVDDQGTSGLDDTLATLDAHPNIEVRLYNPFTIRRMRAFNFVTDFSRLNRRMHNKSFTADDQATIVGGRNIGNEYFSAGSGVWFQDLDVIAVGAIVHKVSNAFDRYWNSRSAYPLSRIVGTAAPDATRTLKARFREVRAAPLAVSYIEALRDTPLARRLLASNLEFTWTTARLLIDAPTKTLDTTGREDILLLSSMLKAVGRPARSVDLVSPYFVPGEDGTAALAALARHGVKVRVLTNSLAATDVLAVHAGYAKRREDLLKAGVVLYELKPSALESESKQKRSFSASSSASLHAKTFAIDGNRVFVGSFNFDQRSAQLNTEMGLLVDSPQLARRLVQAFDNKIPAASYEVRLASDGTLEWIERTPSGQKRYDSEPGVGFAKGASVDFLSLLPIDWML